MDPTVAKGDSLKDESNQTICGSYFIITRWITHFTTCCKLLGGESDPPVSWVCNRDVKWIEPVRIHMDHDPYESIHLDPYLNGLKNS